MHRGDQRHLGRFIGRAQPKIEGPQHRITPHRSNRGRRSRLRPPWILRCPCSVPLSQLNGATPASAAISRRLSRPNSGRSESSATLSTRPTPGTLLSSSYWSHSAELRTARSRSLSACSTVIRLLYA